MKPTSRHLLPSIARTVAAGILVLSSLGAAPARADDAVAEFTTVLNSATNRWCYGSSGTLGGTFSLLPSKVTNDGFGRQGWATPGADRVMKNVNAFPVTISGVVVPAGSLTLEPSSFGYAIVRWKAPRSGAATISARFIRHSAFDGQPAQVAILHGSARVFGRWLVRDLDPVVTTAITLTVSAGDVVDFVAGSGNGDNSGDLIGLDATVNMEPAANAAGPVISFAGQRFVACFGDTAFESMAFDPVNRHIVSNEIVRNLCGAALSQGPEASPGMSWDPRTQTFWTINNARVVKQWSATGTLVGTLFTLPLTFSVPGWGVDTLDNPKGLAVDSNFVYVVDSGPAGSEGQIRSNEWFKFTRTGTPVKSSKLTNFHANLDLDPDAVVDDIVYVPFSNPYLKGKLIIPLEHSGMQVIDTDGNFVSKFRWSQAGVPPGIALAGFAGITIDPVTGNLYLVENSGAMTQIWTRLPSTSATYYAVGTGTGPPRLQLPAVGCNRPLWQPLPVDASLVFGCAYRSANQSIYGIDYGSSQLYRAYAGSGAGGRVTITGLYDDWACAYDTERDVLYGAVQGSAGTLLVAIDPVTGAADPRPGGSMFYVTDLAFDSADKKLYSASGTSLVRIDRDTGNASLVGPTVPVSGIDYDAISNRLIGVQSSTPGGATLWSIDPATGVATSIATVPINQAWEGLAVVPVPAATVLAVEPGAEPPSQFLRALPNPSHGGVALQFSLPASAVVDVGVYDVLGRRVRAIESSLRSAGPHIVRWDGRLDDGKPAASGVYFARVEYGSRSLVSRIVRVE